MPYELSFTKQVEASGPARYLNPFCVEGDVVLAALPPALRAR